MLAIYASLWPSVCKGHLENRCERSVRKAPTTRTDKNDCDEVRLIPPTHDGHNQRPTFTPLLFGRAQGQLTSGGRHQIDPVICVCGFWLQAVAYASTSSSRH
jgi:hypothetical protein